ncbi:hypothetical protein [Olivibacter sp. LS-1]|uniref:hypothetical protein n=1 Tax=Olivibacter sp. LS-1 TaxID=2592345 RepID=UPI00143D55EF|nr:hypothetical protein [Olivibacter sp. LS-1]
MSYEVDVVLIRTDIVRITVENPFDADKKAKDLLKDRPGYIVAQYDIAPTREEVEEL